jgi:hypothetical protein
VSGAAAFSRDGYYPREPNPSISNQETRRHQEARAAAPLNEGSTRERIISAAVAVETQL